MPVNYRPDASVPCGNLALGLSILCANIKHVNALGDGVVWRLPC